MDRQTSTRTEDSGIVRRVMDGDTEAFALLINRYAAYVAAIVSRHVPRERVEEISQEAFVKAYQSLPKLKQADSFKGWLSAITVRACYDHWRSHYRSREVSMSSLSQRHRRWLDRSLADDSQDSWEAASRKSEAREVLNWALARLNPPDRMVLELVYLEGHSVKETAKLLGWTVANVKVRAFRARRKIHKLLLKGGADGD